MKNIVAALVLVLVLSVTAFAQVPVVTSSSFLAWDYEMGLEGMSGFRIYLARDPGIIPDGTSYTAEVAYPALQWAIVAGNGHWYAVATAVADSGAESGPSNEVEFFVLGPPGNMRVETPEPTAALRENSPVQSAVAEILRLTFEKE